MALPTGVTLFTSVGPGPADKTLLVVHGGPDWDHTYLREPLSGLAGDWRLVLPDLRGCGRSTTGLADGLYTPDAVVGDLLAPVHDSFHRRVAAAVPGRRPARATWRTSMIRTAGWAPYAASWAPGTTGSRDSRTRARRSRESRYLGSMTSRLTAVVACALVTRPGAPQGPGSAWPSSLRCP